MKLVLTFLILSLAAGGQQPAVSSAPKDPPAKDAPGATRPEILALLEKDGTRQKVQELTAAGIVQGKEQLAKACTACAPEFAAEWARRMTIRFRIDDVMEIYVRAYVKYLNSEDVQRLSALMDAVKKDPKSAVPPPELKAKLESVLPSMQSEIMGGTTQYGAKLGAEVSMEIEKEHPDWVKSAPKNDKF